MRIVFLGTPEFAIPSLEKLLNSQHQVVAVVTQQDKPNARGNKLMFSPVKQFALEHNIPVLQYEKISREGVEDIKKLNPDIMITAAFGQILSQAIIDIPKYGIINIHGSILPKYRGASPVQTAVINGDTETGITIMQTEAGLDTGDILSVEKTHIGETETSGELMQRLAEIGSSLLLETLERIEQGKVYPEKQHHTEATITKKISKSDCLINWNKSSKQIKCLILGANPDPVARTLLNGEQIRILRAKERFDIASLNVKPGTIIEPSSAKAGVFVQCGQGVLEILEAQFPGGKVLQAKQLFCGRKFALNMQFDQITFPSQI